MRAVRDVNVVIDPNGSRLALALVDLDRRVSIRRKPDDPCLNAIAIDVKHEIGTSSGLSRCRTPPDCAALEPEHVLAYASGAWNRPDLEPVLVDFLRVSKVEPVRASDVLRAESICNAGRWIYSWSSTPEQPEMLENRRGNPRAVVDGRQRGTVMVWSMRGGCERNAARNTACHQDADASRDLDTLEIPHRLGPACTGQEVPIEAQPQITFIRYEAFHT